MPDHLTPQQRCECMANISSKDTRPEQAARCKLWRRGYSFHKCVRTLPWTPDIVLTKYHTCIFVNGCFCFWHGHKGCSKFVIPKTRSGFRTTKITLNQERDLVRSSVSNQSAGASSQYGNANSTSLTLMPQ